MTVIITCGESRQSLAAVRALGRAQIPVAVGAVKRPTLAMWSRFATSTFLTEDPRHHPELFATNLAEDLVARYASCLLVSSDEAFWALSRFREQLPIAARRIFPPHYSVVRSLDHEALHYFAQSLGIACAPLIRIPSQSTAGEISALVNSLQFPLLLRPIISWVEREEGAARRTGRVVVHSLNHLIKYVERSDHEAGGLLVSAFKSQGAISYFGVADRGHVLVEGFQERLSEAEPYSEISTLAMTINPVAAIRKSSQILLEALQWQGPFKIEFFKDRRGHYRLISLTGRLWGSLQLAIKAHVNIPLICYRMTEGTLTKSLLHHAQPNIRLRWLMGDVASKLAHPWRGVINALAIKKSLLHLPWAFRREKLTTFYDVIDVDDPMPFLFELQHKTWKKALGDRRFF